MKMIEITTENYPKLYILLETIAHDSGKGWSDTYLVDDGYEYYLPSFELKVENLTEEELENLSIGEETDMINVVEKYDLEDVHDFLNVFFES